MLNSVLLAVDVMQALERVCACVQVLSVDADAHVDVDVNAMRLVPHVTVAVGGD